MKRASAIALLLTLTALAAHAAAPVHVGALNVIIPKPDGYTLVTQQMNEVNRVFDSFVPPSNKLLAAFIRVNDAPIAKRGSLPDLERYFLVEVARSSINVSISDPNFEQVKHNTEENINKTLNQVEQKFPNIFTRQDITLAEKYDLYLANAKVNAVPLPIHRDTSNSFAMSLLIKYNAKYISNGQATPLIVSTITFLHLKDKVIYLYCYSRDGDLSWSRHASEQWSKAIIAANH